MTTDALGYVGALGGASNKAETFPDNPADLFRSPAAPLVSLDLKPDAERPPIALKGGTRVLHAERGDLVVTVPTLRDVHVIVVPEDTDAAPVRLSLTAADARTLACQLEHAAHDVDPDGEQPCAGVRS